MSTAWEKENTAFKFPPKSQLYKLKIFLYSILAQLFEVRYNHTSQHKRQLAFEIVINNILALQAISLSWYPNLSISGWQSYKPFWVFFGYLSYDSICAELGIMNFCFYGTISLIWAEVLFLVIFGYFAIIHKNPPGLITLFSRKLSLFFTTIGMIPSFMIILNIFKNSTVNSNSNEEYNGNMKGRDLNYSYFGIFFPLISILILLFLNFSSELFSCDMKHTHCKKNITARSSSHVSLQNKAFFVFVCILYVFCGKSNILIFQVLSLVVSLYLVFINIWSLQYFNDIENSIEICKISAISLNLLIFIFGKAMNNSEIITIFNIILQPICVYLMSKFVFQRYKKLKEITQTPKNQFEFERKFRHILTGENKENHIEILNLYRNYWNMPGFKKNKIFVIWEFNAIFSIIKDERLARVKLSKISKADYSLEGDIQEWKIIKYFNSEKSTNFYDASFLKFLRKFNKVKYKDEEICDTLIKLHSEFSSRKPRITIMMNLVDEAGKNLDEIIDGYKKLIELHKNAECYENYASFLENIANNVEEANIIHRKKNVLNIYNAKKDYDSLENYGKDVGVLLISCSNENFGMIVYINEKASQILKISIANANGIPLTNFIPQSFGHDHENLMKNLLEEFDSVDIASHKTVYFVASDGFLIECYIMIKLTVFRNSPYFLTSFKPRSLTNRQVAIISEENTIINHSGYFSHHLNNPIKDFKNSPLTDIIPNLDIREMQDYKLRLIIINNKPLALVRIKKTIKSTSFYCLLVISDQEEILEWQRGNNEDQVEVLSSSYLKELNEKSSSKSKFNEIIENSHKEIDYLISSKENGDILIENASKPSTSKSSKSSYSSHSKQLLLKSKQKVRALQWVLFVVIISVIITMVGILNYIIEDVSHTSKMSSLGDLGKLLYNLEAVTDSIRTLEKQLKSNSSQAQKDSNTKVFLDLLDDLDVIRGNLLADFEQWSFCSSAEIISSPIIPLWNFEKETPKLDYSNLYNAVEKFISSGKKMTTEMALKQNYSVNSKFLFLNGIANAFEYSNKTANEIINCEINRVLMTGANIYALIIVGICVLWILILIIWGFVTIVSKTYDNFWNFLLNKGQISMARLKSASLDRLMVVHGIEYNIEAPPEPSKNNRYFRKAQSNLYMKFMLRILIFFAIAVSYYFLIYFYMYPNCETMMIKRPKLLNNFNAKRALIYRLSIFARECMSPYMVSNFQNSYDFPNPKTMLNKTYDLLKFRIKELKDENLSILMSDELLDRIYDKANDTHEILKYGSDASAFGISDEIYSISYKATVTAAEYYPYIARINAVNDEILYEFSLADRDSKSIISEQLNAMINITIIYSIAVCALFFIYYWPYFNYKVKQFERLLVLPTILVMESE